MKKRIVIGVLAVVLVLAIGMGVYAANEVSKTEDGVIVEGVYAGNINLSGLTAEEAEEAIQSYVDELASKSVTMVTGDHEDTFKLSDMGISWLNSEIVEEAVVLGKHGNLIVRFKELSDLKRENQVYDLKMELNEEKVQAFVEETLEAYNQEAVEPTIKRSGGSFVITDEETGVVVDKEATIKAINELLTADWDGNTKTLETVAVVDEPEHTAEELKVIQDKLGKDTTTYATSNKGRTKSLELSTERLNGTIIWPGETISASLLMGERSIAGGYGTGQGYFGTDVEETVGAGICQTASTLYNAALYAELDIVERYQHTLVVHYVDYGMDATIYAGNDYTNPQKDLKIKNPYDYPVYIESSAGGGYCTFTIYGKETRPSNRTVKYIAKTLSETYPEATYIDDPTKAVGYESVEEGAYPAVKATLTKVVYVDGVETERTLLHTDNYRGKGRTIRRGTKVVEPTTPAATTPAETTPAATTPAETTPPETTKPAETTQAVNPVEVDPAE